jgi:hypothetical protein
MTLTILAIEEAIGDRLRAKLPSVRVEELPNNPSDIGIAASRAQLWVAFRDESFANLEDAIAGNQLSGGVPHQRRNYPSELTFELILRVQGLRNMGHRNTYEIIETIKDSIIGWSPPNLHLPKGFIPRRFGYVEFDEGLWVYSMSFSLPYYYRSNPA